MTKQLTTTPEPVEIDDDFDAMMYALDVFFHVTECPNHSGAERMNAYAAAKQAFTLFVGGFEDHDAAAEPATPNAPTSNKVH